MRRGPVLLAAAATLALGLVAVVLMTRDPPLPRDEVRAFVAAWESGAPSVNAMAVRGSRPAAQQKQIREALRITNTTITVSKVKRSGEGAVAHLAAIHELRGLGVWKVRSSLRLVRVDDKWLVAWRPAALHPRARAGDTFERERDRPERSPILGAGDESLTMTGTVIVIGVQPGRIEDRGAVASALQQTVGIDPARLDRLLAAPSVKPDHFVPLIDVREERYRQVDPVLRPIPGVLFRRKKARIAPTEDFAVHTLGRTGEITAELLDKLGIGYQQGDVVGRSGLELAFEEQLGGQAAGEIRLVRSSGKEEVLHRFRGRLGEPVRTTIRPTTQRAADAALADVTVPAALVAVESSTGAIVAVASRPLDQPLNRALSGRYPPGSTFKVVTTDALIAAGRGGDTMRCPADVMVGGKRFKNFEGEARGDIGLRDAFVHSCNTAFAMAAARLSDEELLAAASRYGFGVEYATLGSARAGGVVPAPKDKTDRAATAIGQGRVLATPAHMASVAAAAATGTWHAPFVLRDGDATDGRTGAATRPTATPTPAATGPLRDFMAAVVTEGSGVAAALPGLIGKTGTAEFGSGNPLPTHAWFIGHRNGIGFALLLEGGGVGGRDAAPIARRFAAAL